MPRKSSSVAMALMALGLGAMFGMGQAPVANGGLDETAATGGNARGGTQDRVRDPARDSRLAAILSRLGRGGGEPRYPRPGFSVRQGQRMAAKRRNRARNRRAHR